MLHTLGALPLEGRDGLPESPQDVPDADDERAPHGWAVAECQDRLEVESRLIRRHFWRRLLPSIGVTSYAAVSVVTGAGAPVAIVTAMFGLVTGREALVFRKNLARLRAVELELASLKEGSASDDPGADAERGTISPGPSAE